MSPPVRALRHPRVLVSLVALLALVLPLGVLAHDRDRADESAQARLVAASPGVSTLVRHTSSSDFAAGRLRGAQVSSGSVTVVRPTGYRTVGGQRYGVARWTSPWVAPGQAFTELVPSWSARTPAGSAIQVRVRVRDGGGHASGWKNLGLWSAKDRWVKRQSGGSQADGLVSVATDTVRARPGVQLTGYRIRVVLLARPGHRGPKVESASAVVTAPPAATPPTSKPLSATPVSLPVPGYSQMIHRGQNPEYGGGGEAWCSPTSLAMLLGYYRRLPGPKAYAWVDSAYADRWVNHLARLTYDHRYRGAGNWPFNTAVGAHRVGDAFVTRLDGLRTAERFLRAGIPLAVSIKFARGQLSGAPISASAGHLVVLSGLTSAGDPIVMDPAGPRDSAVRHVYDRAQFERAWLGGSTGTAYVVHDAAHPLPKRPAGVRAW